jgi:hypothetical protein
MPLLRTELGLLENYLRVLNDGSFTELTESVWSKKSDVGVVLVKGTAI